MNEYGFNAISIIIAVVVTILVFVALIIIKRNKGKCLCCNHSDVCPFKKSPIK